jgi:predicted esterase
MTVPKKISVFLLILLCWNQSGAQTDCVDHDKASYPKSINGTSYPWNDIWNFTNLKQNKITGINFGNSFFKGLLEYLPADYNPGNTTVKHPIIIFFHGGASSGNGTAADLCWLFKDNGGDMATHLSIPGRVERSTSEFTQTYLGETYEYIVVSPQFYKYVRNYNADSTPIAGNAFPGADEVEQVINYMVDTRYANKIDKRRIYLVGYSTGANMISEYAGSSVARAKRVAAIMPVSLCSQLNHPSNTNIGVSATNIAQAQLKTWFVYCTVDNCGRDPALNVPQDWVTAIKNAGGATPRLTMLTRAGAVGTNAEGLYNCSDTLAHDAWSRAFDPNFKASFVDNGASTNANDGINQSMYQWFTQQISAVLPVNLKLFTARLISSAVELKWITTDEQDNASFTIERSGTEQHFNSIAILPGAKNSTGGKTYVFTDNDPLTGLGFYRLVQTDIDGKKTFFAIKKILNKKDNGQEVVVYPNPFSVEISAIISLQKSQNVFLSLTDMSGKVIRRVNGRYTKGSSEVRIASNDLSKGIYFLKIESADFNFVKKVVKQ